MTSRILTIILLLLGSTLYSQESTEPFKKVNTIILHTQHSDSMNFKNFARHLMKLDYSLDKTNADFLMLSTEYHHLKKHPKWSHSYLYRINFIDQKIIIKPYIKVGVTIQINVAKTEDNARRWHWAKSRSNVFNMIWDDTIEMLHDYCECKITYKKQ